MEITNKEIGNLTSEITLMIAPEDYKPQFDTEIKNLRQKSHLKGFRKGKTPASAIKKMYGKSILADILNKKISSSVDEYLKENEINILGEPIPLNDFSADDLSVKEFHSHTFSFKIGTAPEVKVEGLEDGDVYDSYEIKIDKDLISQELENIRKRYGTDKIVDKKIKEGDYVSLRVVELDEENNILENGHESEFGILEDRITDEYRDQILGKGKGDELVVNIFNLEKEVDSDFVRKYFLKIEENKDVNENFKATIEGVRELEPAEMNEEFFEKAFHGLEVKNEKEAQDQIKEELDKYYQTQGNAMTERYILESLVEKNNIELPHEFLKEWLLFSNKEASPEDLDKEYDSFEKSLKWSLIKQSLGKEYEVDVQPDEIKSAMVEKVKQMLQSYNYPGLDYNAVAENYMKEQPEKIRETFEEVYARKVFDNIMQKVTLKKNKISVDDFKERVKKMNEQNH